MWLSGKKIGEGGGREERRGREGVFSQSCITGPATSDGCDGGFCFRAPPPFSSSSFVFVHCQIDPP